MNVKPSKTSSLLLALFVLLFVQTSLAQETAADKNANVKGVVNSDKDQPLEGVSVIIRNTRDNFILGTSTNAAGTFSFARVPAGGPYSFVFSAVGYESQTLTGYVIKDGASLSLLIKLKDSSNVLDQVVVVGYGTQKRKDVTGAISSIKSQDIADMAVTRIDQALVGKAAGVLVKPSTGEPGASPQIRIRGIGSISAGASPLYVIDGFPTGNIETLNPNDIESVDILKDASATAIYGSRGSNGVVIINTKRGKAGKTVVSLDTYYGWQKAERKPKMMNAKQQAQYFYDGVRNRNLDEGNDVSGDPALWKRPVPGIIMDVLAGRNTYDQDALDAVLITAPTSQFQLTVTGGNANTKYLLSGEYLNQDGIVLNSHFTRYSMRANFDTKLFPKLTLKTNLNPSFTDKMALPVTGNQGENILGSAISVSNFYPLLDSAGNYFIFGGLPAQADFHNPLALAREYKADQKMMRFLGNIDAEYQITKQLAFRALLGATLINSRGMTFKPQLPVFFNNPAVGSDNSSASYNWITEYTLNYNKTINRHQFVALAGFTAQKEHGDLNSLSSNKYPNNLVTSLSAVSGVISDGTSESYDWSMLSYLGRVNYNYNSKYYVTASIRTDGSSRFGEDKKYGVFPSAAVSWRLSKEKFLQRMSFLTDLKLRASYGETGNNNIGNYEQFATINYVKYAFGGVAVGGFAPGRLANPQLTWETQKSFNLGVDGSIFNHRISFSVDHFQSRNYDLLLNVNIPLVTGFSTALKNIGEVKNWGWEYVLSTINLNGKFRWSTDFNLSTFRNEVVKLGPEGDPIIADNNITMIGKPIGMFYGFLVNGIFKTQADLSQGPIFNPGASDHSRVGDIRFVDVSGPNGKPDGVINSFDNTIIGSPYPNFYYGMTNRFSYKNVGLLVSLQGSQGAKVYNTSFGSGSATRARVRVYAYNNDYWKSEQDPGDGDTPRPNDAPTGGVRLPSQRYLDDGSYLRINNITLDYVLSNKLLQQISISSVRIYIGATNPFLFTKYKKYNPDVSLNEDPLRPGVELNNYPLPKTLLVGLNASF